MYKVAQGNFPCFGLAMQELPSNLLKFKCQISGVFYVFFLFKTPAVNISPCSQSGIYSY